MNVQMDRIERKLDIICALMEKLVSHQERLGESAERPPSSKMLKKER